MLVTALLQVQNGKIVRRRDRETKPKRHLSTLHLQQCINWFIVLAGLFEQIVKVLLRAIER